MKERSERGDLAGTNLHDDSVQTTVIITQITLPALPPLMRTHMLSSSGNSLIMNPVIAVIAVSNVSIAMFTNIYHQTAEQPNFRKDKTSKMFGSDAITACTCY